MKETIKAFENFEEINDLVSSIKDNRLDEKQALFVAFELGKKAKEKEFRDALLGEIVESETIEDAP